MESDSYGDREELLGAVKRDFGSIEQLSSSSNEPKERSQSVSSQKAADEMKTKSEIYEQWIRPLIAEFFGQLIFAFLHSSTGHSNIAGTALAPAVSDGLTVTILVIIIGHISGAHVNFAVTTAVFVGGGIKCMMVPLYLIAQLLGSLAGAGLAYITNGEASGAFALGDGVSVGQGVLMEVIITALLTLSVVLAAVELNADLAALAIGFSILIGILAGFTVSGGCMNPTLSFGPAVFAGAWTNYWVYWVGPLLGALFSGTVFRFFLGGKARLLFRQETSAPAEQGMEGREGRRNPEQTKG